jgi:tetratricopeptide (TPR) repeat protein
MHRMTLQTEHVGLWRWLRAQLYIWRAVMHRQAGNRLVSRAEHLAAVAEYTRALTLNPLSATAHLQRGVLYWRELGEPTLAVQDLTRALELRPGWGEALFNRGLANQGTGNYRAAADDLAAYMALGEKNWREHAARQLGLIRAVLDEQQTRTPEEERWPPNG